MTRSHTGRFHRPRTSRTNIRRQPSRLEPLETRVLLASTLFVTPTTVAPDATHFHTVQDALAAAVAGDTIMLQSGFSLGSFNTTRLSSAAFAGTNTISTVDPLSVGQVISIGTTNLTDPLEQALITSVAATGTGDYLLTLASPLRYNHTGSLVDATNASTIGKTIGLWKPITLTAEAGVILPFNFQIWKGTTGATLSNLNLTTGAATSVWVDGSNNTLSNLTINNQLVLTDADANTITGVYVGNRVYIDTGSSGNVVTSSNLRSLTLRPASHHNTFSSSTIGAVTAIADASSSGHDAFFGNTFTGPVKITGNQAAPTSDVFTDNTFTVSTGDALTLLRADGTLVRNNTFNVTKSYARAVTVANSQAVVVDNNHATVNAGIAIFAYADAPFTTSVDITNNTLASGEGIAICLGKWDTTANLEARVQGNTFTTNAIGVMVYGDGSSAGNVDLGGGSTLFGASTGGNDFTTFLSADSLHYAIGLASTTPDFTLVANNNKWAVTDPLTLVADSTHNLDAAGSGIIVAIPAAPPIPQEPRTLTLISTGLSVEKNTTFTGSIATFTDSLPDTYIITITWSDGLTTSATITQNSDGSYSIGTTRTFDELGTLTATISVQTTDGLYSATTSFSTAVTNKNGKLPKGKNK